VTRRKFNIGQIVPYDFHMSKAKITHGFDFGNFDRKSFDDDLHVFIERFSIR
jgi:hypothetical protein